VKKRSDSGNIILLLCVLLLLVLVFILVVANQAARDAERQGRTDKLLQNVYEGIVGNPDKGTFGYLGDAGDYPNTLLDLTTNVSGVRGWNGPYVNAPMAPVSGNMMLVDHYGAPLEYFVNIANVSTTQLAIISRGRDHGSTNTTTNPNSRFGFITPFPTTGTYGTSNPDNEIYPDFVSSTNNLYRENAGMVTYTIENFDENIRVNALRTGCPGLYTIKITSVPRGSGDTISLLYPGDLWAQPLAAQLLQGVYDVEITSALSVEAVWRERINILPGINLNRRVRAPRIDSSSTIYSGNVTLQQWNDSSNVMEVWANNAQLPQQGGGSGDINGTSTKLFSVKACSKVTLGPNNGPPAQGGSGALDYETFTMPYGAHQRVSVRNTQPLTTYSLTITNGGTNSDVIKVVYQGPPSPSVSSSALVLGTIYKKHTRTFVVLANGTGAPAANRGVVIQYRRRDDVVISTTTYTANNTNIVIP
jgi:hypothetical protein